VVARSRARIEVQALERTTRIGAAVGPWRGCSVARDVSGWLVLGVSGYGSPDGV